MKANVSIKRRKVKYVPSLSVNKLDAKVYKRLRMRAAKHGVSMEEEARRISHFLKEAIQK